MKQKATVIINIFSCFLLIAVAPKLIAEESVREYWDTGLAEISRYELKQARYGAINDGYAILLFVTEPFSPEAQVKDDSGRDPKAERVLKLNAFKRFQTGIYDYSIMSSVFSSMDNGKKFPTYKVTTSVQDWCGQVFSQWNQRNQSWKNELRSYFQSEGDSDQTLPLAPLEDGIWNRLRLNPEALPSGQLEMIPSSAYLRLKHKPVKSYFVTAVLNQASNGFRTYELNYPDLRRTLSIRFSSKAPYEIVSWSESYPDRGDEILTTEAKRTHSTRSYYWEKNQTSDLKLRKKLGF